MKGYYFLSPKITLMYKSSFVKFFVWYFFRNYLEKYGFKYAFSMKNLTHCLKSLRINSYPSFEIFFFSWIHVFFAHIHLFPNQSLSHFSHLLFIDFLIFQPIPSKETYMIDNFYMNDNSNINQEINLISESS